MAVLVVTTFFNLLYCAIMETIHEHSNNNSIEVEDEVAAVVVRRFNSYEVVQL